MITTQQLENIQIDHGMVFVNYGEPDQRELGPNRGGGEFIVTEKIRDIEWDGQLGKTKGLQVIEEINASLKLGTLDASLENLGLASPGAVVTKSGEPLAVTKIENGVGGIVPAARYLKNITMFAKVTGGKYKKITLFNAMAENGLTVSAKPKSEGVVNLEVFAHWDPTNMLQGSLYKVEDVDSITPA